MSEAQNVKLEAQFSTNQTQFIDNIFGKNFKIGGWSQNFEAPYVDYG